MIPDFFLPVVNRAAPVGPLTHIIRFNGNLTVSACQPGTQPPNQNNWWNVFDTIYNALPDGVLPLANNQGVWAGPNTPTPCVYPMPYTFQQGQKYYAERVPNYQAAFNPNPTMDWEIQVNGLRYKVNQYLPQVTVIGNANNLKQKTNLIYAGIIIFVLALSLRYFTKK